MGSRIEGGKRREPGGREANGREKVRGGGGRRVCPVGCGVDERRGRGRSCDDQNEHEGVLSHYQNPTTIGIQTSKIGKL